MKMKTAFMFSGQGAQYSGMGKELYDNFPQCKKIYDEADNALGFKISEICFGSDERLNDTEFTQPAVLTAGYAAYQLVKHLTPDYVLGLSLGEYTALCASGAFDFSEAVCLVQKRGKFMTEACPKGKGAMSAVLNLSRELVVESCKEASHLGIISAANFNVPGQIVIAGEVAALEKAEEIALSKGAKRCMRLNVSGAFHTELLKEASERLSGELDKVAIKDMEVPVLTNLTGDFIEGKNSIKPTLVKQIMSGVLWEDSINKLLNIGVTRFVELGCGKVLFGFVKKIAKAQNIEVEIYNIEDLASFRAWEGAVKQ